MLQAAFILQCAGLAEWDKSSPGQWETPGILVPGWRSSFWGGGRVGQLGVGGSVI